MDAVIIAAGKGSRMSSIFSPKPLTPIFGLRLLERIILVGKLAGIKNFKIVVGYEAAKIKRAIGNGKKYDVNIEYIDNPEWEKGNGVSTLKARDYVQGKFLLLMSDHLFDEAIIKKLLQTETQPGHCILCIDKNLRAEHYDIDDVTKVSCNNGKINQINKGLKKFNAIDTGVFLCTPAIFDALETSTKRGDYSLAAGNQVLAEQQKLDVLDVTGCFWVDVDNEEALKKAKQILILQLFKQSDGPISKMVNRRLSTRFSAYLAQYNISPNAITLLCFILSVFSAVFFYCGGYGNMVMAGILAQLSSVLDGCDGEIARLKFKLSTFGEWLDRVLDRYADGFIILGMTHAIWISTHSEYVWLVGFLALTGTYMNSYTARIYDEMILANPSNGTSLRLGRDVRIFIIFLGALCNQLFLTLVLLIILTNVESIRRILYLKTLQQYHAKT